MTDTIDGGKRRNERDSLYLTAQLSVGGAEPIGTRVRNLSARGMLVDLPVAAAAGDAVTGEIRGVGAIAGMIAWVADGRAGVAFDEDVDPKLARTSSGAKSRTPAYVAAMPFPTAPAKRPGVRRLR